MQPDYPVFRKRLDAALRQREPAALRAFLIAEGQWTEDTTTDPERAMWMMIATSPALAPLHADAIAWLIAHGYAEEARALGSRRGGSGQRQHVERDRRAPGRRPDTRQGPQHRSHHPRTPRSQRDHP
jgi:hypothetical protein